MIVEEIALTRWYSRGLVYSPGGTDVLFNRLWGPCVNTKSSPGAMQNPRQGSNPLLIESSVSNSPFSSRSTQIQMTDDPIHLQVLDPKKHEAHVRVQSSMAGRRCPIL